ncbi:G-protein coupled receptor Mth2-like isoform X2 [Schistocerca nitens]|uniref:G-protein coupled receptor Mth2-like isoform X2 n=1 Tax=Schistocerca nitens TaxID=7011 RepID=UPI0021182D17|nr:G-protein coupled receptor Mth2-like isoform X2 [Schistocerca nitens]
MEMVRAAVVLAICQALLSASSAAPCAEPPGRDPACLDKPVEMARPQETEEGDMVDMETGTVYPRGLHWSKTEDNNITCGCSRPVRPQLVKCCPPGEAHRFDEYHESYECFEYDGAFEPVVTGPGGNYSLRDYESTTMLPCKVYIPLMPEEVVEVSATGRLRTVLEDGMVEPRRFCLETLVSETGEELVAGLCWEGHEVKLNASQIIYIVTTMASTPFLLATAVTYAVLPQLWTLHGRTVASHASSMFVAYLLLSVTQILSDVISDSACVACAFIIYFSFLASFFWLNVMCFDIFWTFSGFRSLRGTAREREHKKFIIYSIYSWGCPLILLSVTLVMQFHNDIPDGLLRPQFGVKRCWFPDDITILAYFYGPVGVLVLCNIILFILTAIRIAQLKRETAMLKGTDSRRHDDDNRQRFNLYLKLFLVMGVNWSMEVISGLVGGPEYVWYVTDICNTLQGVLIFVIFVWKDRIRRMLMEKFCPKRASTKLSKSTVVTYSTRASPSRLSHGVLNNKVTDNSNGDVKITAITPISDDSDVP